MTITSLVGDNRPILRDLARHGPRFASLVTSVPYLEQRAYGNDADEIGHEATVARYVDSLLEVFELCRPLLLPGARAWINIGDKANGSGGAGGDWDGPGGPGKFLDPAYEAPSFLDVPGALTRMMLLHGWRLRATVIWDKGVQSPESLRHVKRPRVQHEPILLFAHDGARPRFYPSGIVGEETGTIWRFPPGGDGDPHNAPFPDELARRCIGPSTLPGDHVLDPFGGSGTVARVADQMGRHATHIDLYTPAPS